MKTLRHLSTIISIFILLISINLTASNSSFNFPEEDYIDDIPFNTELIYHYLMLPEFDFEEEAYINDIPFNTSEIVENYNLEQTLKVEFTMEEESYIDDIPFNTSDVVKNVSPCKYNDLYASGK